MYNLFQKAIIIVLGLFTIPVMAGDKLDKTINVEQSEKLIVEVTRGIVKITSWDKPQITIKGELDDSVNELYFKNHGNKTLITAKSSSSAHWGNASTLHIFVPTSTAVYFDGVDTTFSFTNIENGIAGETISGSIKVSNSHHKVYLSSISGDITIDNSSGVTQLKSVSGDISLKGKFDKAAIKSMSGNIATDIDNIEQLMIKNVSGDINIHGQLMSHAKVKLASVSGNIHYQSQGKLNAECSLSSQFGGSIKNQLTSDLPSESMMKKQELNFVSGDGSGKLIISTISGSISLTESQKNQGSGA